MFVWVPIRGRGFSEHIMLKAIYKWIGTPRQTIRHEVTYREASLLKKRSYLFAVLYYLAHTLKKDLPITFFFFLPGLQKLGRNRF